MFGEIWSEAVRSSQFDFRTVRSLWLSHSVKNSSNMRELDSGWSVDNVKKGWRCSKTACRIHQKVSWGRWSRIRGRRQWVGVVDNDDQLWIWCLRHTRARSNSGRSYDCKSTNWWYLDPWSYNWEAEGGRANHWLADSLVDGACKELSLQDLAIEDPHEERAIYSKRPVVIVYLFLCSLRG